MRSRPAYLHRRRNQALNPQVWEAESSLQVREAESSLQVREAESSLQVREAELR